MLTDLIYRLRAVFRQRTIETELDAELRFHLENEAEKLAGQGLTREEAWRQACLTFGSLEQVKEGCRDARGIRWLEDLLQDFRYAFRRVRSR